MPRPKFDVNRDTITIRFYRYDEEMQSKINDYLHHIMRQFGQTSMSQAAYIVLAQQAQQWIDSKPQEKSDD
jgi:hypothetical protein